MQREKVGTAERGKDDLSFVIMQFISLRANHMTCASYPKKYTCMIVLDYKVLESEC
jgi:hypothetical protein